MDIKKGRPGSNTAPTPNNTPSVSAPIASSSRPSFPTITEVSESQAAGGARPGDLFAGNTALVNMLQGRLGSLMGRPSGYISTLSPKIHRRIYALKTLQRQHTELEKKYHLEVLELEKKYNEQFSTGYSRRKDLVLGSADPTDEEVDEGKAIDGELGGGEGEEESDEKGIPEFWLTAMKNHITVAEMITDRDEGALRKLREIRIVYTEEKPGFRLEFEFDENEWFENKVLTKTYFYQQTDNFNVRCEVSWRSGKDLSVEVVTKKQRHKATKKTRVITSTVPADTFFNFFKVPNMNDIDSNAESDDEDEAAKDDELKMRLEEDYDLGEEFKEKLVPHAIDWFTGKALEYEGFDMESEDDYDEDSSDEEDDDDEDEDDF